MRFAPFAFVLVCVLTACADNPNVRTPDWEETVNEVNRLSSAGDHERAIAVSQAYLKTHPDNVDGLLMVAGALQRAAEAASDSTRPQRFEQAAQHYKRALELTDNSDLRWVSNFSLVRLYGPEGLNQPDEAMRYAQAMSEADPKDAKAYTNALLLLKRAKKYDEAVALMVREKRAMESNEANWAQYGEMVQDLVSVPDFPHDRGMTLVNDTMSSLEQAMSTLGRTQKLLRTKALLLRTQAEWETNSAKQGALLAEAKRLYDESVRAEK